MIVAMERNSFNYILKYNSIIVSNAQIFDLDIETIEMANSNDFICNEFDRILPVFELDQEVLILAIDKSKLLINSSITLPFNSIESIYPLTAKSKVILSGKLNQNLELKNPIFEIIIERVKFTRAIRNRELSFNLLRDVYLIKEKIDISFTTKVQSIFLELFQAEKVEETYLSSLMKYNYTPNEISSGNIENLEKIGIIAFIFKAKTSDGYTLSPFYIACENYKKEINENSYSDGYIKYHALLNKEMIESQWKQSDEKIKTIVSEEFEGLDFFKISYYYLAIKTKLNKNDGSLIELDYQIIRDIFSDEKTMIHVLYLICYTFSFEQLYESLHILTMAPLFKKKFLKRDIQSVQVELQEEQRKLEDKDIKPPKEDGNDESSNLNNAETIDVVETYAKDESPVSNEFETAETYIKENANDIIASNGNLQNEVKEFTVTETVEPLSNDEIMLGNIKLPDTIPADVDNNLVYSQNDVGEEKNEGNIQEESPTIRNFEKFILKNVTGKDRIGHWKSVIALFPPNKDLYLTVEDLNHSLSQIPDFENKLFKLTKNKSRFDKSTIIDKFFKQQ